MEAEIVLERFQEARNPAPGRIRLLAEAPALSARTLRTAVPAHQRPGRHGPACTPTWARSAPGTTACWAPTCTRDAPCDRHVLAKRLRAWVNADGFLTALDRDNLVHFEPGPPARWSFVGPAGDGRTVQVELTLAMLPGRNTVVARFLRRPGGRPPSGRRPARGPCT